MSLKQWFQSKQPLSLKWKWGILLFVSFLVVAALSLKIYQQLTLSDYRDQLRTFHQENFEDIQKELSLSNGAFNSYSFKPISSNVDTTSSQQKIVDIFANNRVVIRVFNPKQQLVYETKPLSLPLESSQAELKEIEYQGKHYIVGNRRILAKNNSQLLGTIQYIVLPDVEDQFVRGQNRYYLLAAIIHLILSLGLAFILSNFFLRPLSYVNNTLDLLEEDNLSEVRVMKPRSNDEWSDLSLHVNRLLDKIDLYVRNQKQFVEDVSHELRTPVAIVEGHLKMLNRWGKQDTDILEESIAASLQEITRMKDLVQEMLDLSRADHVDIDYKDEITEIVSTTRQVFNNFTMLYPDFQFYIDSERDDEEIYVKMFRNHYEQILIILLDNAVKYSTDRKEIHLSLSQGISKVQIAVQDFGEGMTEEDKERVFARFYRVDKARSRHKGGNGLGLSIAKQLVEGYKGIIRVESVYQHGSIFYIEFPIITDQRQLYKSKKIAEEKLI
ncbi:sensor histidine kinase [Facklamia lactis]|uniref:sensor histidine kinase n=1 Tax=Facklamia lactis TaxID=2749967 RepID=UPI0018CEE502|nr:ATP-binding protein [Facklamia lactis]MBG9980061.1 HAMP domain-containing histidine kinase [Facklamia lactis]